VQPTNGAYRLTLSRAPNIIATFLDETLPEEVTLFELAAGTLVGWEEQWGRVWPP
jgi:hypothetical protein